MVFIFYIAALITILATFKVIINTNPIYSLLYLIISLLTLSIIFFSLGSYFAGTIEIIIYTGAIMVLFIFIFMMLNLDKLIINQELNWLKPKIWVKPTILSLILFSIITYSITSMNYSYIKGNIINTKDIGITLLGPYMLTVEFVSLLLLSSLIITFHIGHKNKFKNL